MAEKLTPMMRQYVEIKRRIPSDAILLFRMGDFYEMFFEDAEKGSKFLDIALTKRQGVAMCGIPLQTIENYLPRLIESGLKVAIADQVEDPSEAKGIVKREITRIITPGTVIDASALSPSQSNYLAAISEHKEKFGIAWLDISTGEFQVTELNSFEDLENELCRLSVKECVLPNNLLKEWDENESRPETGIKISWTPLDDWYFDYETAEEFIKRKFEVASLDGFGCKDMKLAISAAGAALYYATENLQHSAGHINTLKTYYTDEYMILDSASRKNLEIVDPQRGAAKEATLINVLDKTCTPMGGRLLREWILRPLFNKEHIIKRLDAVNNFKNEPISLAELRETFIRVKDLERIVARLNFGTASPRDLMALSRSLTAIPDIKLILEIFQSDLVKEYNEKIHIFKEISELINRALVEEPPITFNEGGIIRDGYNEELDELRKASTEGKEWIASLQAEEQKKTGIKSLKVRYNKVFGYYIEVTKSNLDLIPQNYIRKQTLVNAERFITPELKEVENKVLGADDKAKSLEYKLFQEIREKCLNFTSELKQTASSLASLDVLASFAEVARENNYIRPQILNSGTINIEDGRHPVIESSLKNERFVPNDSALDADENKIIIITGPNMAGKSTYIRQVALIVLMAQAGCFIPAGKADIGIVDRIFTRVGAADDISRGQSTFMVEMVETANILNHATNQSLIILDEIGRGTSTFDGLSIAWAVAEYLHNSPEKSAKTLFATHYHEITELAMTCKGVKNYNVAVREYQDNIVFLRKILPGAADKSYGIYVAKMAGLPTEVITRANEVLTNLENNAIKDGAPTIAKQTHKRKKKKDEINENQPMLFNFENQNN